MTLSESLRSRHCAFTTISPTTTRFGVRRKGATHADLFCTTVRWTAPTVEVRRSRGAVALPRLGHVSQDAFMGAGVARNNVQKKPVHAVRNTSCFRVLTGIEYGRFAWSVL